MNDRPALQNLEKLLNKGRFDEVISECDRLLQAAASDPALQLLKETAERRRKLLSRAAAGASLAVRQFTCATCGATLPVHSPESVALVCGHCGQSAALEGGNYAAGVRFRKPFRPRYTAFLQLGQKGRLFGADCEVIGRIHYEARTEEWDDEDRKYTSERWEWEEVCLLTDKREFWYLIGDREAFYLAKAFTPKLSNEIPSRPDFLDFTGGGSRRVVERGVARAVAFEGEFPWLPQPTEEKTFAEYNAGKTYSVEWRGGAGVVSEVEFFESVTVAHRTLLAAFNCTKELAEYDERQAKKKRLLYWAAVYAVLALALFGTASVMSATSGRLIYQQTLARLSQIADEGEVHGPIEMNSAGEIYAIGLQASIPDNTEAWAGVELLNADQDAINAVQGDFWRESGYDDEGRWSESDLSTTQIFKLTTPGRYYLRVFGESGLGGGDGPLYVEVREGAGLARYFFLSGLLAILGAAASVAAGTSDSFTARIPRFCFFTVTTILLFVTLLTGIGG